MDFLQNVMGYFTQQMPLCAKNDHISRNLYQEYGVKPDCETKTARACWRV